MRLSARGVGFDFSGNLAKVDPSLTPLHEVPAWKSRWPNLLRESILDHLCADSWNGKQTPEDAKKSAEAYLAWNLAVALPGIEKRLSELGLDPHDAAEVFHVYAEWCFGEKGWSFSQLPLDGSPEAVAYVKSLGLPRAIGTNWDWEAVASVRSAGYTEDDFPDFRIHTSAVHGRKPGPWLFEAAAESMGIAVSEMVWVGDSWKADVLGALRAGCAGVIYLSPSGQLPAGVDALPAGVVLVRNLREIADRQLIVDASTRLRSGLVKPTLSASAARVIREGGPYLRLAATCTASQTDATSPSPAKTTSMTATSSPATSRFSEAMPVRPGLAAPPVPRASALRQ